MLAHHFWPRSLRRAHRRPRNRLCPGTGVLLAACYLAGCAASTPYIAPSDGWQPQKPSSVLLFPPAVFMFDIRTGGLREENVPLTLKARSNVRDAMVRELRLRGFAPIVYEEFDNTVPWQPEHAHVLKLHGAVLLAMRGAHRLPTQPERPNLDHGLGRAAEALRKTYDARYALFFSHSEGSATPGRMAVATLFALGGVLVPTRPRQGFASLVDLSDGNIVWFGDMESLAADRRRLAGNPGTEEGARALVGAWLEDMPL